MKRKSCEQLLPSANNSDPTDGTQATSHQANFSPSSSSTSMSPSTSTSTSSPTSNDPLVIITSHDPGAVRDIVIRWLRSSYRPSDHGTTAKRRVFDDYLRMCRASGLEPTSCAAFGRIVHAAFPGLQSTLKTEEGTVQHHYNRLVPINPTPSRPTSASSSGSNSPPQSNFMNASSTSTSSTTKASRRGRPTKRLNSSPSSSSSSSSSTSSSSGGSGRDVPYHHQGMLKGGSEGGASENDRGSSPLSNLEEQLSRSSSSPASGGEPDAMEELILSAGSIRRNSLHSASTSPITERPYQQEQPFHSPVHYSSHPYSSISHSHSHSVPFPSSSSSSSDSMRSPQRLNSPYTSTTPPESRSPPSYHYLQQTHQPQQPHQSSLDHYPPHLPTRSRSGSDPTQRARFSYFGDSTNDPSAFYHQSHPVPYHRTSRTPPVHYYRHRQPCGCSDCVEMQQHSQQHLNPEYVGWHANNNAREAMPSPRSADEYYHPLAQSHSRDLRSSGDRLRSAYPSTYYHSQGRGQSHRTYHSTDVSDEQSSYEALKAAQAEAEAQTQVQFQTQAYAHPRLPPSARSSGAWASQFFPRAALSRDSNAGLPDTRITPQQPERAISMATTSDEGSSSIPDTHYAAFRNGRQYPPHLSWNPNYAQAESRTEPSSELSAFGSLPYQATQEPSPLTVEQFHPIQERAENQRCATDFATAMSMMMTTSELVSEATTDSRYSSSSPTGAAAVSEFDQFVDQNT